MLAATAAWWASVHLLDSPVPFLAPWTALLTVHVTVYRSLARGVQTAAASTVGVGVSFLVGHFLGVNAWTFGLAMMVGVVGSRIRWLREEGIAIATTAIFILGSGFEGQTPMLDDRLLDVGLGVLVGLAANALIVPPLRDQQASWYVDSMNRRMGQILVSMSSELASSWSTDRADAWVEETLEMERELTSAWQTVHFARESSRMNPRGHVDLLRMRRGWRHRPGPDEQVSYEEILSRVGEGISHLRHLARTVRTATYADDRWDDRFRQEWVRLVGDAGEAIQDPDAEVEPVYQRVQNLAEEFAGDRARLGADWPIYGSLLAGMRHIALIVDDVASARAAREGDRKNPAGGPDQEDIGLGPHT